MKKLFTLILIAVATLSLSCKKDNETSITPKDLFGSWELRYTRGGMAADASPTYPPGNGIILKFTETTYERLSNGQPMVISGTYKLSKDRLHSSGRLMTRIIYDGEMGDWKEYLEIIDGKLKVYDGEIALDGIESVYQKLQVTN